MSEKYKIQDQDKLHFVTFESDGHGSNFRARVGHIPGKRNRQDANKT